MTLEEIISCKRAFDKAAVSREDMMIPCTSYGSFCEAYRKMFKEEPPSKEDLLGMGIEVENESTD